MSSRRKRTRDETEEETVGPPPRDDDPAVLVRRHSRFGWWSLLCFLTLGIVLEALHGFKVTWYLEVAGTTRRFLWTLAHAHGTLLAVLNLVFAATLHLVPAWSPKSRSRASASLLSASLLLPAGFFLGGLFPYEGDPGLGVVLVPLGGLLLLFAVLLTARAWSA